MCRGSLFLKCGNWSRFHAVGQGPLLKDSLTLMMASKSHQLHGGKAAWFQRQEESCYLAFPSSIIFLVVHGENRSRGRLVRKKLELSLLLEMSLTTISFNALYWIHAGERGWSVIWADPFSYQILGYWISGRWIQLLQIWAKRNFKDCIFPLAIPLLSEIRDKVRTRGFKRFGPSKTYLWLR